MKVVYSEQALKDLDDIAAYLAANYRLSLPPWKAAFAPSLLG